MSKVSRRGGFSDRYGIKKEKTEIQLHDFDKRTRTQLHNMLNVMYESTYNDNSTYWDEEIQGLLKFVIRDVYSEPVNARSRFSDQDVFKKIDDTIYNGQYDDVLTVIEAIVQYLDNYLKQRPGFSYYNPIGDSYINQSLFEYANNYFAREYVGYRFVGEMIVPISDAFEVETINTSLQTIHQSVRDHILKANHLLADRESPDYENSIKESILAVETICKNITSSEGKQATLGNALKKLEETGIIIHPGLKAAFEKLYGYTCTAKGIRHTGDIGGPESTFEEAKFMLVACCAFINYLTALQAD